MCLVCGAAACGGGGEDDAADRPASDRRPAAEWQKVEPGGATRTARGAPYAFWVRPGDPDRLLLFFEGGGGCFTYETCQEGSSWFDDTVDDGDDPSGQGGILDRFDARNPFRDYSAVFIPSATGDLHWGDARATYRQDGRSVTVEHRGFVNAMAAVRWAFRNVPAPRTVFVTGCSAGSVGSAAFAPYVLEHYPRAEVNQLGDGLAFVFSEPVDLSRTRAYANMPRWIPAVRALRPGAHTMADYYAAVARRYPRATFSQLNYASDRVQRDYYAAAGGRAEEFDAALERSLSAIRAASPNFRSYTSPGSDHCVLPDSRFYTERHDGTSVIDWVTAVATGREVQDVPGGGRPSGP